MKIIRNARVRAVLRGVLAVAFLAAGVLHLVVPGPFLGITPGWVPWPDQVIRLTGVAEIAGALGLMVPRLRRAAGVGLALFAVCVFPANIKHTMDTLGDPDAVLGWAYHGPRLVFQPVIVWWCLWAGEVVGRRRESAL